MPTEEDDTLAHYGVEGMRWGIRKDPRTAHVNVTDPKTGKKKQVSYDPNAVQITRNADGSISAKGNKRAVTSFNKELRTPVAHPDHRIARETLKKNLSTVSNKDLQATNQRLNLEKQYSQLRFERSTVGKGKSHVGTILGVIGTAGAVLTTYAKLSEPKNQQAIKNGYKFIRNTNTKNITAFVTNPKVYSRAANVAKLALKVAK